jgi:hypothetical protein
MENLGRCERKAKEGTVRPFVNCPSGGQLHIDPHSGNLWYGMDLSIFSMNQRAN